MQALTEDKVLTAKLALRTLACLCSCGCLILEGDGGFIQILETLLAATASGPSHPQTNICLYLLAHTMPYCTTLQSSSSGQAILALLIPTFTQVLASYKSLYGGGVQSIYHAYAQPVDDDGNPISCTSYLSSGPPTASYDSLYDAILIAVSVCQASVSVGYTPYPCIAVPWLTLSEELTVPCSGTLKSLPNPGALSLSFSSPFSQALTTVLATGQVGTTVHAPPTGQLGSTMTTWLYPRFAILDADCGPAVTALLSMPYESRAMLVAYMSDVLHFFEPQINPDGTRLGSIELLCKHLTAVQNVFLLAKPTKGDDWSSVSVLPLLAELLIQCLLALPSDSGRLGMVFRVILEMSRLHSEFAPLVALVTSQVYHSLNEMDSCAMRQLAKWLGQHLINTQLVWPYWGTWVTDCEEEGIGSQKVMFCRLVVDHLGRALVGETVRANVPQQLHDALPANPTPTTVNFDGSVDFTPLYDELYEMVDNRLECDDVLDFLDKAHSSIPSGLEEDEVWRSSLLVSACISVGGVTPSAIIGLFERYSEAIRSYCTTHEAQVAVVQVLAR